MFIGIWFETYFATIRKIYSIEYNVCSMNEISMYYICHVVIDVTYSVSCVALPPFITLL